jgi:hypothetical protein
MCVGVQEAIWLAKLIEDFGGNGTPMHVYSDNTGALANFKGIPISPRTKHIGVRYHRVRDEVERGFIVPHYINTVDNVADVFPKSLPKPSFQKFREMLGMG